MSKFTTEWFKAALIRAIRTFAQTMLSMITIGSAFHEVNWVNVFSVSGVAAILSICTSIVTGLPEASDDGSLIINDGDEKDIYTLELADDPALWATKKSVTLPIKHATLPIKHVADMSIDTEDQ